MAQSALDLRLDRSSDIPLGTQLAWKLRGAIAAGRLAQGDRLPGVREMAAAAGVNVNTVRAVYARLADQGAIVSEHGRGTFVGAVAGQDELVRLAERAAHEARQSGVDPRELAALLYAAPGSSGPRDEAAVRGDLRVAIERLERQRADLEAELALLEESPPPLPEPAPAARRPAGARLLGTVQLQSVHDELAQQVGELRRQLAEVRDRDGGARPASSVPSGAPESVVSGGTWTLRWRL